jgi:hypothetical protein
VVLRASALLAVLVAWFATAPHLPAVGHTWNVVIIAAAVLPATMLLVLALLPLWSWRWDWAAAALLILLAVLFTVLDWGLPANFAKLLAMTFAGWAFLQLFEELSWVVLIAVLTPLVDIFSVLRGPTKVITESHFHVYETVAIAFVVPGHVNPAYLGPPDVLFFALFVGAAARWGLRPVWTWVACAAVYSLTLVTANVADVDGLPALPFLSVGFFSVNGDLLWRRWRRDREARTRYAHDSDTDSSQEQ